MSELKGLKSLKARFGLDKMSNWGIVNKQYDSNMADKVNSRGKEATGYANPLIRLREDKLRSLKRALYNSYQSAVIQFDKDDREFHFRCLMNHDKLKVDYEDKILSIPYRQVPIEYEGIQMPFEQKIVDVGTGGLFLDEEGNPVLDEEGNEIYQYRVKPGDTFKWISGNQGYMPDSYWIIFLQYSEQTAYFRGQIRKADDIIQIIPIEEDGSEGDPLLYHGWTVGPNQEQSVWNVKKGVVWNDLYYTKILYITKDEYLNITKNKKCINRASLKNGIISNEPMACESGDLIQVELYQGIKEYFCASKIKIVKDCDVADLFGTGRAVSHRQADLRLP